MNDEQIANDLFAYLKGNASTDLLPAELSMDFPLLESGAIDSLELFKLVAHLEDTFGIEIKPEEISPANFASIQMIVALVQRHSPQKA